MRNYLEWAQIIEFRYWPKWLKVTTFMAVLVMCFIGNIRSF